MRTSENRIYSRYAAAAYDGDFLSWIAVIDASCLKRRSESTCEYLAALEVLSISYRFTSVSHDGQEKWVPFDQFSVEDNRGRRDTEIIFLQ